MKRVRFEDIITWQTRESKVYFYNKSKSNETFDYLGLTTYDYPRLTTIIKHL